METIDSEQLEISEPLGFLVYFLPSIPYSGARTTEIMYLELGSRHLLAANWARVASWELHQTITQVCVVIPCLFFIQNQK